MEASPGAGEVHVMQACSSVAIARRSDALSRVDLDDRPLKKAGIEDIAQGARGDRLPDRRLSVGH
jgi:hypothetical protein